MLRFTAVNESESSDQCFTHRLLGIRAVIAPISLLPPVGLSSINA
jgi:hypothetical protein